MATKNTVYQRCLWGICPPLLPGSGACFGHADVKHTGFLEKDDISASSATSGHPRRESACCLPLALRCCWLRNPKRSFKVISELHLKCRTAMPEKAEKVHSFNGGRQWMCLHILPHLRSLLAAGVMLLLSCTTDYMYGVGFFKM